MTLVILAAGMGSRYGGLKQIDPVGPNGEFIVDYSIYDAIKAGFDRVVFIIKQENLELFRETVGKRIEKEIKVEYAFQDINDVPDFVKIPDGRTKPWGTAHAVLSCANIVDDNFAVINADDFYGRDSYQKIADFLRTEKPKNDKLHFCMAGFILENTLTENGHVSRGICEINSDEFLTTVTERTKIQKNNDVTQYFEEETGWTTIPEGSTVSMNCWGFTPEIFSEIKKGFAEFFKAHEGKLEKAEFYLPFAVQDLIDKNVCDVKVLSTDAKWYGVTYHEDKAKIVEFIQNMTDNGVYPNNLWAK